MMSDPGQSIQDYWEDPSTISIIDRNLHELEIAAVSRHLKPTDSLADVGCGDGSATVRYAARVRTCTALERSARLRGLAEQRARESGLDNLTVRAFDILDGPIPDAEFDVVVSQRMLINLPSWEDQQQGIRHIHRMLKPGGLAILVENTNEAFQALNRVRVDLGLSPVPQHWHNRFFDDGSLRTFVRGGFQLVDFRDFGLYYLLTRVYTQMFASFEGWGAQARKDPLFERADAAARALFERMQDQVTIAGGAFGPIQLFVLRREAGPWRA